MKKISFCELANLMGGYTYSSCAEVQFAANTHETPSSSSEDVQNAENKFWADWIAEYERLC